MKYALICEDSNEWIYEAATFRECKNMLKAVGEKGKTYCIVRVLKDGLSNNE